MSARERGMMNATGGADGGPGVDGGVGQAGGLEEQVPDVATLRAALDATGYLADDALATALFLAARMGQPILLEGEPGVGKTEAAKALAQALATPMLRLQCYEGLTSSKHCMSGTIRASCWRSGWPRHAARRCT